VPHPAVASAVEFLAQCNVPSVRLHAARSLSSARRFGPVRSLRDDAERDMFARDVRDLFLLPYAEARRHGRLRGRASGVLGSVLSSNASVAMNALLARGCREPGEPLRFVLSDMLGRVHADGFCYEPYQEDELRRASARGTGAHLLVTAAYVRFFIAFGQGRDARVRRALDWLVSRQDRDGAWRAGPPGDLRGDAESYLLTRAVAEAFAELPVQSMRRYAAARRRLSSAWANRILPDFGDPDAVLTSLNITSDPAGPGRGGPLEEIPSRIAGRILYFALEDLYLAAKVGASPDHPHLAPWLEWLRDSQLADGSWRLGDPSLRERLLVSDPNGRLRAEALYLTDEWITLRGAQVMQLVARRSAAVPAQG
jgi:hypothetical protein